MKILASKREYPNLPDYIDSVEFDANQIKIIQQAFDLGLSSRKIALIANPEFNSDQMLEILRGFAQNNLPLSQVVVYADPRFDAKQMQAIKLGFIYPLSAADINSLIDIVEDFPEISIDRATQIVMAFGDGLSLDQIMLFAKPEFNSDQMFQIVEGFAGGLSEDQVRFYADPRYSQRIMHSIRTAYAYGATVEELSKAINPNLSDMTIRKKLKDRWGV